MNTYDKHPSVLDVMRKVINNTALGDKITRAQIMECIKSHGTFFASSYIDNTRRQLTVTGILDYTGTPGIYIVIGHIPNDWTMHTLKKMYDEMLYKHQDTYINNSKKFTEKIIRIQQERDIL